MKNITTILFDIDGTILDTSDFIIKATEYALSELGYEIPERSVIASTIGKPFPDYYYELSGSDQPEDAEKLIEKHRAFQFGNYHLSKLYPNTLLTLKALRAKGYNLAAVTTRSRITSYPTLKDSGIYELFDVIISWEDVEKHKPDPEPLLMALENLKQAPEKAVMVGDSHLDIEAGKNAGTKTIRVAYGFHKDNMYDPEPDYIIQDIKDLLKIL